MSRTFRAPCFRRSPPRPSVRPSIAAALGRATSPRQKRQKKKERNFGLGTTRSYTVCRNFRENSTRYMLRLDPRTTPLPPYHRYPVDTTDVHKTKLMPPPPRAPARKTQTNVKKENVGRYSNAAPTKHPASCRVTRLEISRPRLQVRSANPRLSYGQRVQMFLAAFLCDVGVPTLRSWLLRCRVQLSLGEV